MAKFLRNFDFDIICYDISKNLTNKLIKNQSDYLKSELDIKKYITIKG